MTAKAFNGKESQANVRCSRLSPYPPKGKSASSPLSRERHGQKHGHCAVREPFSLKGDSVSCWRSLVTGTHGLNPHLLVCKCANSPCLNRGVQSIQGLTSTFGQERREIGGQVGPGAAPLILRLDRLSYLPDGSSVRGKRLCLMMKMAPGPGELPLLLNDALRDLGPVYGG